MWIAKSDGGVVRINLTDNKIKEYNPVLEDTTSIGKFRITHILEDSKGNLFSIRLVPVCFFIFPIRIHSGILRRRRGIYRVIIVITSPNRLIIT